MKFLNSTDNLRKYLDLEKEYKTMIFPKNKMHKVQKLKFDTIVDDLAKTDEKLTTLMFHYKFLEDQPWLWNEYKNLWKSLGTDFATEGLNSASYRSHTFLYYGTKYRTRLHAAPPADYFLQVANTKKWRFVHKRYIPYYGGWRIMPQGVMGSPDYFIDNFPEEKVIPHTEVTLQPGDLMYFTTWHIHEVFNTQPEKVGLAIGIRPFEWIGRYTREQFAPLSFYNFVCIWGMLHHSYLKGTFDFSKRHFCVAETLRKTGRGFNGTTITRFDYKDEGNGICNYHERQSDFQPREMRGELGWKDWYPKY